MKEIKFGEDALGKKSTEIIESTEIIGSKIKYMIERKSELERVIRVGKEAENQLEKLNKDIRFSMAKYLFMTGE